MAIIKMDISEYEALLETKKLLKESAERERESAETISKLNQEKIDALNASKHKVVKTIRKTTVEHVLVRRDAMETVRRLVATVGRDRYDGSRHILSMGIDHYESEVTRIIDAFFDRQVSESMEDVEELVEEIGIEEFKAELKDELQQKMDKSTSKKIAEYPRLVQENLNLEKEVKNLDESLFTQIGLREKSDKAVEDMKQLRATDKVGLAGYADLRHVIRHEPIGFFTYGDFKRKLEAILDRDAYELKHNKKL